MSKALWNVFEPMTLEEFLESRGSRKYRKRQPESDKHLTLYKLNQRKSAKNSSSPPPFSFLKVLKNGQ